VGDGPLRPTVCEAADDLVGECETSQIATWFRKSRRPRGRTGRSRALPPNRAAPRRTVLSPARDAISASVFPLETPVLHTVHGPLDGEGGRIYERIARTAPRLGLTSLSLNQRRPRPDLPWVANCPNAIDPSLYPWTERRGDYLLFLGRMGHNKGAHRAIAVARESGLPLKIAAKCREPAEIRYFREFVEPHLDDRIEYVGEVGDDDKVELLQSARATLFPIDWEEPFGLVMIESMAYGTPVIATRRGRSRGDRARAHRHRRRRLPGDGCRAGASRRARPDRASTRRRGALLPSAWSPTTSTPSARRLPGPVRARAGRGSVVPSTRWRG
jgi:hypothetical protein